MTAAGTAASGVAWLAGTGRTADVLWLGVAICGLAYACWVAVAGIAHGRLSVDVIALLALAGRSRWTNCLPHGNWVWIFSLSAEDGHTRLISRNRMAAAGRGRPACSAC